MAHRISGTVWKSNGHRGQVSNYGALTSFSKHHRHEALGASHSYWEKRRSLWLAICVLTVLCIFTLPASMEIYFENPGPGHQALLRKGLRGLPFEQRSHALYNKALHENMEVERSNKEWQLKPNHFTLFNLSSKFL